MNILSIQVKDSNMRLYCNCAGEYTNMVKIDDFAKQMKTFKGIARYWSLLLLFFLKSMFQIMGKVCQKKKVKTSENIMKKLNDN